MATNYTKTPYKVQKRGGTKKYGVMAGTFEELKAEGCKHLGLQSNEIEITLEDNTIVDTGYFQSLKPDTLLIFESKHSEDKVKSLGESLEACSIERKPNIKAENLDTDEDNYKDRREDDEKWFEGVLKDFKTKSEFMRDRAKIRTGNYFRDTKDMLLPKNSKDNTEMIKKKEHVIEEFKRKLKKNDLHANYFDKNADGNEKLCNHEGKFVCQGAHIKEGCRYNNHHINPYLREEYRKTFSAWNFNHRIHIGREVLRQLKEAVEKTPPRKKVNLDYFYGLLFTKENFKFVHPACFDKTDHKVKVDKEQVFLSV